MRNLSAQGGVWLHLHLTTLWCWVVCTPAPISPRLSLTLQVHKAASSQAKLETSGSLFLKALKSQTLSRFL